MLVFVSMHEVFLENVVKMSVLLYILLCMHIFVFKFSYMSLFAFQWIICENEQKY